MRAVGKAAKLNERGNKSSHRTSKSTNGGAAGIDYRKLSRDMLIERIQRLEMELSRERASLEQKVRELAVLSGMVLAGKEQAAIDDKVSSTQSARNSWRGMGVLGRWKIAPHSLKKQRKMIAQSHLFDEVWYLKKYPDVKHSGIAALDHYLKFGAAEARDPGPDFSTSKYIVDHPAVLETGLNPLYHYLCEIAKSQKI